MDEVKLLVEGEIRCSDDSPLTPSPSSSPQLPSRWRPSQLAFKPYSPPQETLLWVVVQRPVVARLTKGIIETYQTCNPKFKYAEELNPKRFLTSPSDGVLNDGYDNANSDLILTVNYVLVNSVAQRRYIVRDVLGHGTFGQVAKCWVPETNSFVAVKIIKNQPAYYQQALIEVSILTTLNKRHDPEDKHHIVRIIDHFVFQRHLCISFELLDSNLYELIKINKFRGLSLSIVQLFSKQILCGLALMKEACVIHCDLKPENILLCTSVKPAEVKIIDFGSACMENRTVYSYIQSRYYRSPEVLLGYQYTTAIDMWSFGCIVAELFLGLPLFPGASEFDLLKRMIHILGAQPPDYVLKEAKNTSKFFKYVGTVDRIDGEDMPVRARSNYQALTEEEYAARENKKPIIGKEYFNYLDLEGIVVAYPYKASLTEEDRLKEGQIRLALLDFLKGLVEFDPAKRWSPFQASKHPFVTGEPFTRPYIPPQETPRVPVMEHNFRMVNHHPGGGHWFAAGLSPNVPGRDIAMHATTPQFQMAPYAAHGSSYGSLGSYGNYSDYTGVGSSYGSYGDNFSTLAYFSPSGMNKHGEGGRVGGGMMTLPGTSPDSRDWMIRPHHCSQGGFGVSPSTSGSFAPLPLGTSPSQFTPPKGSYYNHHQVSVSGSPGVHYGGGGGRGPSSPAARGCSLGSPLGKGFAASHFMTRRKNWGSSQEGPSSNINTATHWQEQYADGYNRSFPPQNYHPHVSFGLSIPHVPASSYSTGCCEQHPQLQGGGVRQFHQSLTSSFTHLHSKTKGDANDLVDKLESESPDPGDWDPNYSDDLLLQEGVFDGSSLSDEFSSGLRITEPSLSAQTFSGLSRFNHSHNADRSAQRLGGPSNAFSHVPVAYQPGYGNPTLLPHSTQNSDRLGQYPLRHKQFTSPYGRSSAIPARDRDGLNKFQHSSFSFNTMNPRSPREASLTNNTTWEPRANFSIYGIPPSSPGRKNHTRIAQYPR